MIAALPPVALSAAAAVGAASSSAVDVFREACVYGRIRLVPDQVVKITASDLPPVAQWPFGWRAQPKSALFIKVIKPAPAYLAIGQFDTDRRTQYATKCVMFSTALTVADGLGELRRDNADVEIKQTYIPVAYLPEWTADAKRYGYVKAIKKMSYAGWFTLSLYRYAVER